MDDGFALIQAFHSPILAVRGISVVFGNAPLSEALPIAQRLVREFGSKRLAVTSGASSGKDPGVETDASRAIAAALRREGGGQTAGAEIFCQPGGESLSRFQFRIGRAGISGAVGFGCTTRAGALGNLFENLVSPNRSSAVDVISPAGFKCDRLPIRIEQRPDDTVPGPNAPAKPYLLVDPSIKSKISALYCSAAPASFRSGLLRLLSD